MSSNEEKLKTEVESLQTQLKDITQNLEDVRKDLNTFALLSKILIKSISDKKDNLDESSLETLQQQIAEKNNVTNNKGE